MGVDSKTAFSSIRISQGPSTSEDEIRALIKTLEEQIKIVGRAVG